MSPMPSGRQDRTQVDSCVTLSLEANTCLPLKGDFERMARRRYQDPTPKRRGAWWTLRFRQDEIVNGKLTRIRKEVRLALIEKTSERDARRLASEHLRPLNQGLESIGSAVNFQNYVEKTYILSAPRAKRVGDRRLVLRNCVVDEGRPLGVVLQEKAPNHLPLLRSKAVVVSSEG